MIGVMKRYIFPVVFIIFGFAAVIATPTPVNAALIEGDNASKIDNIPQSAPKDVVVGVLNAAYAIIGAIAILVIVGAGILYTISEGDAKKTQTAKDAILYAVIGLVVVGSAFIITGIVQNIGSERTPAAPTSYTSKEILV